MEHLKTRLEQEGINETSIQEILQYVREIVKDAESEAWQEGCQDGYERGHWVASTGCNHFN